ncbi:MAG: hypothetical protein K2O32_16590 [Acetatifactor sp.]|nr:hypothetical protein [Acetatifactor sp.]
MECCEKWGRKFHNNSSFEVENKLEVKNIFGKVIHKTKVTELAGEAILE